ncbi:EpsG family protein [Paenibacillus sp. L3-i20]|uniref:EpsG family protein n=1 Tax=Paenibacillus sp. L3-i20 TaxID=2905833 RepID=UPI001EDCDEF5|nr:EpsG family protein [Paenibacillus sp. L3-i20]GKU75842.1 transmembrane protein EpsG [Paenibacillus sp. L3-i20]
MIILWVSLVAVTFFGLMSRYFSVPIGIGALPIQPNKLAAGLAAVTLVLVSGLRNNIGDTYFYMHGYEVDKMTWELVFERKEIGFSILQMILQKITSDPQILLVTTAVVTNILIVSVLYKYSRMLEISLFVYITSGAFIVSMNGLRQFLAAAIVFAGTKFLLEGRWKPYMLLVLFASLFHQTALIMVPIYFVARYKAWTRATMIYLSIAIMIVLGYNYFSDLLFAAIADTNYGYYQNFQEGGSNFIRVLVSITPLVIAYIGRERLRELFPNSDIFVNLSILSAILMIISTQNWIFARLTIYFNLYQLVLIGWVIKLFREKDQRLVYLVMVSLFVFYFFYENVIILDIKYESNYIKWPF